MDTKSATMTLPTATSTAGLFDKAFRRPAGPVAHDGPPDDRSADYLIPALHSLADTGLSPSFLIELLIKIMRYTAEDTDVSHLAPIIRLPAPLVKELLDTLIANRQAETVSLPGLGDGSFRSRYRLTEAGSLRAEQALERCRYAGPAPVTLDQYKAVVTAANQYKWRPSAESIQKAVSSLILDDDTTLALERSLSSGRCAMVFGPSGNGKTHLLTEFLSSLEGTVLVPHAIYAYGQVIRVFDAVVHVPIQEEAEAMPHDARWVRVQRPGMIVGGELTADSLELAYDPVTHFYRAPIHVKAQGGVLVVDDLGRQRVKAADLLNRWVMSLELGRDNLLLRTGELIDVPYHVTLLLSTNLAPADLADPALLRRIPYKVLMPSVVRPLFAEIMTRVCSETKVRYTAEAMEDVVAYLNFIQEGHFSGALARDLLLLVSENCRRDGRHPELDLNEIKIAHHLFSGTPLTQAGDAAA